MLILVWLGLAIGCGIIGQSRGVGFAGPFLVGVFLTPIVGLIAALVMKPRDKMEQEAAAKWGAAGEYRKCPQCAEVIKREAVKCRFCGSEVGPTVDQAPATVPLSPPPATKPPPRGYYTPEAPRPKQPPGRG